MSINKKKRKKKRTTKRRKRIHTAHDPAWDVEVNGLPPILDPREFLAMGCPPELLPEILTAQEEAHRGNMAPMQKAYRKLEAYVDSDPPTSVSAEECNPLSTPAAAEILFAIQSTDGMDPEYEQAARTAYAVDPHSVEALCTLGDHAKSKNDKLKWYRLASEAAKHKPRGRVAAVMPKIRMHMGRALMDSSLFADAIEILRPGLDESPSDENGLRFEMVEAILRLRWYDELHELVANYDDPPGGVLTLASSIARYQENGETPELNQQLLESHQACPQTARYLTGLDPLPDPGASLPVDKRHAAMVAACLLPGVRVKPGTIKWIRETLHLLSDEIEHDELGSAIDTLGPCAFRASAGDLDVALELPLGTSTWQYVVSKVQDGLFMAGIVDDASLVALASFASKPVTADLRAFVLEAICAPVEGQPRKPAKIVVATKADLNALRKSVGTYGVECVHERMSPRERKKISETFSQIASQFIQADAPQPSVADADLDSLQQSEDIWAIGLFQPPFWIYDQLSPYRPYMLLVVNASTRSIIGTESWSERPSADEVNAAILQFLFSPMAGEPCRPMQISTDPDSAEFLHGLRLTGTLIAPGGDEVQQNFTALIHHMLENSNPMGKSLDQQEGVSLELMSRLYNRLAKFYRLSPWTMVGGDTLIELRAADTGKTWGVSIMGQLGQTLGISIIEDVAVAKDFIKNRTQLKATTITVQFVEPFEMPPSDHWSMQRHGWEIAGDEAYPLIAKMIGIGNHPKLPSHDEIAMLESLLLSLVHFIELPNDPCHEFKDSLGNRFTLKWKIR